MLNTYSFLVVIGISASGKPVKVVRSTKSKTLNGAVRKIFQEFPDVIEVKRILYEGKFGLR